MEDKQVFMSAIYAHSDYIQRRTMWYEINALMIANPAIWCCIGDFNVVLGASECRGANNPARLPMDEFKAFSNESQLIHLTTRGAEFTWTNRRRGRTLTEKRLDRPMCNDGWLGSWNQVSCNTLPRISSDHHPLFLNSSAVLINRFNHFRFHSMWINHLDSKRVVTDVWQMHIVVNDIQHIINCSNPNLDILDEEFGAQKNLLQALMVEEDFWREKAKLSWHISGDRNTKFFQKVAQIRQKSKALTTLKDGDSILSSQAEIANHALLYFSDLYASKNIITPNSLIASVIPALVSEEDNIMLTKLSSYDEIKCVVFDMKGEGAPRPYEFGGCFYQAFWDIVGLQVCEAVLQFFSKGWILPNLNSNSVVLIPKFPRAIKIEDFRPIALANFQLKIITKVLVDRLALIAPKIISNQQRGFIRDRHIHDCICIASEAINMLDYKSFGGNVIAIKLDIRKAFDTVDWSFSVDTLRSFGFDDKFVHWVKLILHSTRLYINVNGHSVGLPFNYLGVPLFKGKPKKIHLQAIADGIILKLATWKGALLSLMGRVECGGLGLKSLKTLNHAALLKLAWEIASSNQEWAIFYRQSVLLVDSLNIPSGLHNSLLTFVTDFTDHSKWIIPKHVAKHFPIIAKEIASIGISSKPNVLLWDGSNDGQLSLKEAFSFIVQPTNPRNKCKILWSDSIPPFKSFTSWRLLHRKMPTDENLQRRGCNLASICSICKSNFETSNHSFLECYFVVSLWQWLSSILHTQLDISSIEAIFSYYNKKRSHLLKVVVVAAIIHTANIIWFCRNHSRFEDTTIDQAKIKIKLVISMLGNSSKLCTNHSLQNFYLLRSLNISIKYNLAPKIIEVLWGAALQGWTKVNTDGATHGAPSPLGGRHFQR
ncbi:PREDICTED: uncharacterized protein LOC109353979 [Lupinus angustifolius]|uniref:uncharacterized protein LOC109353979 n=1 Tax=Lupinus angustifolius TaxID=3871 RepID=UPI00092E567D|nr:PREDICTED: uncharacterized protein LOC109353979 [Lupinus angustifolius]